MKNQTMKMMGWALVGLLLAVPAFAEHGGKQGWDSEKRIKKMAQRLNLTEEQQTEMKKIYEEKQQEMKALHEKYQQKIQALLTEEQKKKFEEWKTKKKEKMEKRKEKMEKRREQDSEDKD